MKARIKLVENQHLLAFADVEIAKGIVISGYKIYREQWQGGCFLAYPALVGKSSRNNCVLILSKLIRNEIKDAIFQAYNTKINK